MGPRLLRVVANTIAVFAVLAGLLGIGLALVLSVYTRYEAETWHYILIGGVALALVIIAAIIFVAAHVYERRRIIRDCWDAVKNADALDPDEDPAIDPDLISEKTVNALAAEVVNELADESPTVRRQENKKKMKIAIGALAVAVPVALTGALLAMQKKLDVYKGKNTQKTPVVKSADAEK